MGFFALVNAILQMLPMIIDLIKQIEAAFPAPDQGPAKLQLLLDTLHGSMVIGTAPFPTMADFDAAVSKIVGAWVNFFNSIGTFKKA